MGWVSRPRPRISPRFNPKTPMPLAKKMADIARRGLLFFSGDLRILLLPRRRQRAYLKSLLRRRRLRSSQQLAISRNGNFSASPEGIRLKDAFESACRDVSRLSHRIREIEGMSGQRYRSFINNFVRSSPDARYLEVGSWAGSTATAALFGNQVAATCIDNWSKFGGPRSQFFANIELVLSDKIGFRCLEQDFRAVDFQSIGQFNIYFFDGPHAEIDHYDGIVRAQPALAERHLLIVDDWNWSRVRTGTLRGLADANCTVESSIEVRTSLDNSHPQLAGRDSDWHNGYFLGIIVKRSVSTSPSIATRAT